MKDIHNLLFGTGIGRYSYAVVRQGRVDEILYGSPEKRRLLIEEAADIFKYRMQKEEAIKKLESAERDLLRLDDLIAELCVQLESLKKEADKLKLWRKIFDECKKLEVTLLCADLKELNLKISDLKNKIKVLKAELSSKNNHLVEFEQLESKVKLKEEQLESHREKILNLKLKFKL
ncbi:hypothetical protein M1N06_01190 [Peptococcaceae bacterium]|nr:hypothetical protein [Peptococcaceae bacterium]